MSVDKINSDWNSDLQHSFGGKYRAYDYYKNTNTPISKIDEAFEKNDIYTRFIQFKRSKYHNPVYVANKRDQMQADIIMFTDPLMQEASKHKYLLIVIDVYTKFSWVFPLKRIIGKNIAECLQTLFTSTKPKNFTTDAGKEFLNTAVQKVFNEFNIKHYVAKSLKKASVAERYNLTIQRLIYQLCKFHNTNDWCSDRVLKKALKIYHNRTHRTIKMSPNAAELSKNQSKLRKVYKEKYLKAAKKHKKPRFKVGDTVRISNLRSAFTRGYHQNFTSEVWVIHKVLVNLPRPRYIVKDQNEEVLDSVLNENEIVRYTPSKYRIEKIIKSRRRNGKKQALVRWQGYSEAFDSWVDYKDLENV